MRIWDEIYDISYTIHYDKTSFTTSEKQLCAITGRERCIFHTSLWWIYFVSQFTNEPIIIRVQLSETDNLLLVYVASIGKVNKDYVTGEHFTTFNQYPHAHVYEYSKCKLKTFIYI